MTPEEHRETMRRTIFILVVSLLLLLAPIVSIVIALFWPDSRQWSFPLAFAVVVFLIILNGQLRGRKKEAIDGVIGLVWIGLMIWVTALYGWRTGLFYLLGSFGFAAVCIRFAAPLARILMRG